MSQTTGGVFSVAAYTSVSPTSVSQTTTLHAGDKISLKGGVVYYGQFSPNFNNEDGAAGAGNAIYVVGGEWGSGPAVISG